MDFIIPSKQNLVLRSRRPQREGSAGGRRCLSSGILISLLGFTLLEQLCGLEKGFWSLQGPSGSSSRATPGSAQQQSQPWRLSLNQLQPKGQRYQKSELKKQIIPFK